MNCRGTTINADFRFVARNFRATCPMSHPIITTTAQRSELSSLRHPLQRTPASPESTRLSSQCAVQVTRHMEQAPLCFWLIVRGHEVFDCGTCPGVCLGQCAYLHNGRASAPGGDRILRLKQSSVGLTNSNSEFATTCALLR